MGSEGVVRTMVTLDSDGYVRAFVDQVACLVAENSSRTRVYLCNHSSYVTVGDPIHVVARRLAGGGDGNE
jgi:hypothetical protein